MRNVLSCHHAMLHTVSSMALYCQSRLPPLQRCRCTIAACPHILQVLTVPLAHTSCRPKMALTPTTLGTCAHALGTGEPGCVGRSDSLFFYLRTTAHREPLDMRWLHRSPPGREVGSGTAGHVMMMEPSLSRRRDLEPLDTWPRQSPRYQ
jgi:hypothetical protein